jgi:hypothetical protein
MTRIAEPLMALATGAIKSWGIWSTRLAALAWPSEMELTAGDGDRTRDFNLGKAAKGAFARTRARIAKGWHLDHPTARVKRALAATRSNPKPSID